MSLDLTWYNSLVDDDGTNTTGTPWNKAAVAAFIAAIDLLVGNKTAVAFAAGNFTANGSMTWTLTSPDQVTFAYQIINKQMTVWATLANTTVGGTPNTDLRVLIPASKVAAETIWTAAGLTIDNGVGDPPARVGVTAGGTVIQLQLYDGTNWAASTNATFIYFTITFPIN